jgi:hypothetical protein
MDKLLQIRQVAAIRALRRWFWRWYLRRLQCKICVGQYDRELSLALDRAVSRLEEIEEEQRIRVG